MRLETKSPTKRVDLFDMIERLVVVLPAEAIHKRKSIDHADGTPGAEYR
ncbi:MAG: hypothetical protein QF408_06140 [Pirellulales bacterium]|jgi:hypothetical protein|nr:hypothetical protein [Pirellulales bacterium]